MTSAGNFSTNWGIARAQLLIKADQEPSIECLVKGLVEARPEGRTVVEEAPKDSKGSNGEVERAVQEVEGQIRSSFFWLFKKR